MDYKDYQAGQTADNFWFRAKYKLIELLMDKNCSSNNQVPLKILSIGTGTGDDLKILDSFGDNYVTDILPEALSLVPDEVCYEKRIADACDLPYEDNFFDIVVSFDVFEHIENDTKAVSEVYRTLKKGGALVYSVPAGPNLFSSHDVALEHFRRYDKKMVRMLFADFEKTKVFSWNSLLYPLIAISRIKNKNSEPKVDHPKLPKLIDILFYYLILFDNFLIKRGLTLPVGVSITGWCKK
ncbi:MAG: class I SAM-dependent methyltransferase [Saprospiraceae bacterium]|nr:class I SAM-dependent methyltransferase [Saprospiraceae bacterium]